MLVMPRPTEADAKNKNGKTILLDRVTVANIVDAPTGAHGTCPPMAVPAVTAPQQTQTREFQIF